MPRRAPPCCVTWSRRLQATALPSALLRLALRLSRDGLPARTSRSLLRWATIKAILPTPPVSSTFRWTVKIIEKGLTDRVIRAFLSLPSTSTLQQARTEAARVPRTVLSSTAATAVETPKAAACRVPLRGLAVLGWRLLKQLPPHFPSRSSTVQIRRDPGFSTGGQIRAASPATCRSKSPYADAWTSSGGSGIDLGPTQSRLRPTQPQRRSACQITP